MSLRHPLAFFDVRTNLLAALHTGMHRPLSVIAIRKQCGDGILAEVPCTGFCYSWHIVFPILGWRQGPTSLVRIY